MIKAALVVTTALLLGGCAALRSVDSDVSTYSQWPAERRPGTYAIERLPSQQDRAEQQQRIEDAARPAIEAAGFVPAAEGVTADVVVQLGARLTAYDRGPYDNLFWWYGGYVGPYRSRHGFGTWGPGFSMQWSNLPVYEREVAVLIRDHGAATPLFEAHAVHSGSSSDESRLLPAMFEAAMKDFPNGGVNPRRVVVDLPRP